MNSRKQSELNIRIQIDATAWSKLMLWTDLAQGEVSAFGTVEHLDNILKVTDFHLVEQVCNDIETEMDTLALSELMLQVDDPSKLRCWTHSHADMGVFWSGTDNKTIEGLANGEWLLSIVVNKHHQALLRLDQFHPAHMYLDNVPFEVSYPMDKELEAKCKAEFKHKVQERGLPSYRQPLSYTDLEEAMDWMEYYQMEELCDI